MPRVLASFVLVLCVGVASLLAQTSTLPNTANSLKIAVIGDNGTGDTPQYEVANRMVERRGRFAFDVVLMLGDNLYGGSKPSDYVKKFELPYKLLLDAGVKFQASLGNHDSPDSHLYPPFNMGGKRYYTFARGNVRFVILDTNLLDREQVEWARATLKAAREDWKIAYFHHPLYCSAGRHGSAVDIRVLLEPIFVEHGVHVALSGHDHIYERLKPQKGIHYFVVGSSGQLRKGDLRPSAATAVGFDEDRAFLLVEIDDDEMFFEAVSRSGAIVDSGVIRRLRMTTLTSSPER